MPAAELDTRGLYCPVPVLRTRERLRRMSPGEELAVLSDDAVILEDLPAWCRSHGHRFLGHEEVEAGVWRLRLVKEGAR